MFFNIRNVFSLNPKSHPSHHVQKGSEFDEIKKAYRRKGLEWRPDKHTEENREVATREFQKIGAAFAKLQDSDSDEDYDSDDYDMDDDILFDLFAAHMGFGFTAGGYSYTFFHGPHMPHMHNRHESNS